MRVVNVAERLVACLSEYLPLHSVYRKDYPPCQQFRGLFPEEMTNRHG